MSVLRCQVAGFRHQAEFSAQFSVLSTHYLSFDPEPLNVEPLNQVTDTRNLLILKQLIDYLLKLNGIIGKYPFHTPV